MLQRYKKIRNISRVHKKMCIFAPLNKKTAIKMKKAIISLVLAMMSVAGYAQSVVGKWVTEGGDSQVEIYQSQAER